MSDPILLAPNDLGTATLDRWVAMIGRADQAGWPMVLIEAADPSDPIDGLAVAAFCASRTDRIGLCASIDPATIEPFTLARGLATLDHLTGGRAAWRLSGGDADRNAELIVVVAQLLLSWDAGALVGDHANGMMSDPDAVEATHHQGAFFAVRGPLNVPRPPQGVPPLIALPGDPPALTDLRLAGPQIARCSIDQAVDLLGRRDPVRNATLRDRLGIAA